MQGSSQLTFAAQNAHNKVYGGFQGVELPEGMEKMIAARRAKNPTKRLHHHAFRCRNAEETRHFYEDILGFPLTQAVIQNRSFGVRSDNNFCHIFFELGDGSALAFFDCTGSLVTRDYGPGTGFDHHVALYVESDEVLQYYKSRLDAAKIPNSSVDYIVYHSLYVNDPNGLNLEFCANPPITADYELKAELVAHRDLKTWMDFAHSGHDTK
jgi:glyoxylase I family protein